MQYNFFTHLFLVDLKGFFRSVVMVGLDNSDDLLSA